MPHWHDIVRGNEKNGVNSYLGIQYLYATLSDYREKLNSVDYYQQLLKHKTRTDRLLTRFTPLQKQQSHNRRWCCKRFVCWMSKGQFSVKQAAKIFPSNASLLHTWSDGAWHSGDISMWRARNTHRSFFSKHVQGWLWTGPNKEVILSRLQIGSRYEKHTVDCCTFGNTGKEGRVAG